jgi:tetratricopeptide (TPR) repeat protein
MKRPKYKIVDSVAVTPVHAGSIAAESARIRKLIDDGKLADAWQAAKALQENHENDPLANYTAALVLYRAMQKAAALRYAEAAIKYAPDNPLYHQFLGKLYVDLEMLEFVPAVLEKAAALDKTLFQAPWTMAEYYLGLGQGDNALQYYKKALEVAPIEFINQLKMDYAACFAAVGRVDEAETLYSGLFRDPVLRKWALIRYALLRKVDQSSEIADHIRAELAATDLNRKERSSLLLCMGQLFENGGKYDEAFENFQEARKLSLNKHDIRLFRAQVDDKINSITQDVATKFRGFGDPSAKPIFVVGMPRSGTTLTEQIIAAHSQVVGIGEIRRMGRMARKFSEANGMSGILAKMTEAGPTRWKAIPQQYLNLLNALAPGIRHTVDKMPHNFLHLDFIHFCFPNAKIIHCRRNPLDNFISAFQNNMSSSHGYAYDQVAYGEYYLEYMRLMDHWKSVLPQRIYDFQYENLTQNPEAEVRKILDFLELPWEEACLSFNERQSTVRTFSQIAVRNPINKESIARWRHYDKHLSPIISVFKQAGVQI